MIKTVHHKTCTASTRDQTQPLRSGAVYQSHLLTASSIFRKYFQPCQHILICLGFATALSFPTDDSSPQPIQSPGGSSTASSRDASPSREISPLVNSLKPPTIIRRGPQGFGFTIRAIRVYFGDSDYYTVHHLVMVSLCSVHHLVMASLYSGGKEFNNGDINIIL